MRYNRNMKTEDVFRQFLEELTGIDREYATAMIAFQKRQEAIVRDAKHAIEMLEVEAMRKRIANRV